MKALLAVAVLLGLSAPGAAPTPVPVLVELFTSEGCSSCPGADALLETLQREQTVAGAEVVPIGLHVDYFDHLGWKDPFSSSSFTARQQNYSRVFGADSMYTPQMVVDGRAAVVGNDGDVVRRAIGSAALQPHLPVRVTAREAAGHVRLTITLPATPADAEPIQLVAALTEDGLTSIVKRGENSGRTLHHVAVARSVQILESLTGAASVIEKQLSVGRSWRLDAAKVAVWLQGSKSRHVYGAATSPISRLASANPPPVPVRVPVR
jgi:hypothetical protein